MRPSIEEGLLGECNKEGNATGEYNDIDMTNAMIGMMKLGEQP